MVARRAALLLLALAAMTLAACGGGDDDARGSVAGMVGDQLRFVDPQSSSVVAVDLRYDGPNWEDLRPLVSRILRAYREAAPPEERLALPANTEGALAQAASFAGLRFEEDVRPALDGHLVIGATEPPRSADTDAEATRDAAVVLVYRTREGNLRPIAEKVLDGGRLRPLRGYDDTVLVEEGIALVGDDTLVAAFGSDGEDGEDGEDGGRALRAALDRGRDGAGYPPRALEEAERDTGLRDALVLAAGDLRVVRQLVAEDNLQRAREEVPYLRAIRRAAAALDVDRERIRATARVVTDGERLREEDLPVAGPGEVALPEAPGAVTGGSRDQSRTTTFASRVARTLFADSRFARAVERAERDLGVRFEEEVLRQFSCPSVSVLEPRTGEGAPGAERFAARSCVRDPERMRELLPRLRPHLPAILTGLQGLGEEGLIGLLLVAPDAPLTPGGLLAQIGVKPLGGGGAGAEGSGRELLYEISGLREERPDAIAQASPDALVFGLIGDAFVVASDRAMARRAAALETAPIDQEAGSAIRVPLGRLLARAGDDDVSRALAQVLGDLTATVSAEPQATVARAELRLAP
jgi:hypothetical protein